MSVSEDQAVEAAVFLTLYKEAIETLEQSALRDSCNEAIDTFTDRVIRLSGNRQFRRACTLKDAMTVQSSSFVQGDLLKDVRTFQFSHYVFSKYLPLFMTFQGSSKEIARYIAQQASAVEKDIRG